MKTPSQLTELFREQGLKVTSQRVRVFHALHDAVGHPTAEEVWNEVRKDLSTVSLRTVYQTLNDLVAMGEISQLQIGTGSSRFDPNSDGHHHLVCNQCGDITDIAASLAPSPRPTGNLGGFVVEAAELTFRGVCGACRAA